jgi:hypothetical protein
MFSFILLFHHYELQFSKNRERNIPFRFVAKIDKLKIGLDRLCQYQQTLPQSLQRHDYT